MIWIVLHVLHPFFEDRQMDLSLDKRERRGRDRPCFRHPLVIIDINSNSTLGRYMVHKDKH